MHGEERLIHIIERFDINGTVTAIQQIKSGYINDTYCVETRDGSGKEHRYTMQRINRNVFPDVDALMENYELVTNHLHEKFLLEGHSRKGSIQMVRHTLDGGSYLAYDDECWRMTTFFQNTYSMDIPDTAETFYYAGRSFGRFLMDMSDVPVENVHIVIPNFHNTWTRYLDLEAAIAADPVGRVQNVGKEIAFIRARRDKYPRIAEALATGRIPVRITHNDTNLNNILFDVETRLPVAVIDLDTVMPSSPLYDFGDSIRIGTNTACDDEKDLSKVSCDLGLYERYARGWLETCGQMLTNEELALLPYAAPIITSEDGIRFLMDYINGDTYYKTAYAEQNLDRSRTQLAMVEDLEKKKPQVLAMFERVFDDLHLMREA